MPPPVRRLTSSPGAKLVLLPRVPPRRGLNLGEHFVHERRRLCKLCIPERGDCLVMLPHECRTSKTRGTDGAVNLLAIRAHDPHMVVAALDTGVGPLKQDLWRFGGDVFDSARRDAIPAAELVQDLNPIE